MDHPRDTRMNAELETLDFIVKEYFRKPQGLYDYQKDLYWRLEKNIFNVVNKSRQIGISFFYGGYTTLKALTGDKCLIASNSDKQAKRVMLYIDQWLTGIEELAYGVQDLIVERNKSTIRFEGGGEVHALPNSPSTIRGNPANRIFFDEFAHFLHGTDELVWEALLPSISRGEDKSVCVNSTPFGESGAFFEMYTDKDKYPDFEPVFYHYSECQDIKIEKIKRNMDALSFQQEYEGMFIGDLNTYYPYAILKECLDPELDYVQNLFNLDVPLYVGIDLGRRVDFTAIAVLAEFSPGKLTFVYKNVLKTMEEKRWENQYAIIRQILSHPRVMRAYIDNGFGQELVEKMQGEFSNATPFTFTNENKAEMHPLFRKRLEEKKIAMPEDMEVTGSLHLIRRTQSGNGVAYGSDKRTDELGHADLAVSLVLANYAYEKESGYNAVPSAIEEPRVSALTGRPVTRGLFSRRN